MHGSVADNIALAVPDATVAQIEAAARRGADPRPHHATAGRLRHRAGRGGRTIGRGTAAAHHRPRDPGGHPGADPRRGHRVRRSGIGIPCAASAQPADPGPHRAGDRPSVAHHHRRRPDRRARPRPDRRTRHPRRVAGRRRPLPTAVGGRPPRPGRGHNGRRRPDDPDLVRPGPADRRAKVIAYTVLALSPWWCGRRPPYCWSHWWARCSATPRTARWCGWAG